MLIKQFRANETIKIVRLLKSFYVKLRNYNESNKINANHLKLIAKLYKSNARLIKSNNNIY